MYFNPDQLEKFRKATKEQKTYSMTFLCKSCMQSCSIGGRKRINNIYICKSCVEKREK